MRRHADGRKSLFLSSHAGAIVGWSIPEAPSFLRDLTKHATQREFGPVEAAGAVHGGTIVPTVEQVGVYS